MNRIERVGCCFLLTMMTIVTSLMFHGRIGEDYNILYLLSASNIIAGLESGLLCFPITYIVSVMFQSARSRNSINKSDKGNMSLEQISQNYLSSKMELFNEKKRRKSSNLRYTQKNYRSRRSSKILNRKFSHSPNSSQNSRADAKKKLSSEKVDSPKKSSESLRSDKEVIFPNTTHRQRSKYKQSSNYRTRKLEAQKFRERRKSRNSPSTKLPIPSSRFSNSSFTKKEIAIMDVDPGSSDFKPLPWFFRYIGWMIIGIVSTGCCVLSIIYGISYGYNDTMKWLISLLFAILESIFILEPIKCVILAYIAVISNSRLDVSEWIPPLKGEVASQRHENRRKVLKELIRERRTSPIYKGPVSKKDKIYSMESETTDQSL
uniref:polycystic kidney disease protein 1-like 2 n=1 Tax=Styela clava TaxID=7725 RepID=UPI00193A461F|nr:polycystic kidney disease protein 1-like 2 [Styela clava]